MILVSDASALIALATCDSLSLLEAIFGNSEARQDAVTRKKCQFLLHLWPTFFREIKFIPFFSRH
jgi:hypothetical protein